MIFIFTTVTDRHVHLHDMEMHVVIWIMCKDQWVSVGAKANVRMVSRNTWRIWRKYQITAGYSAISLSGPY